MKEEVWYLLIDLIDVGFNINISNTGDILSILIKYDVPDGDLDAYNEWLNNNNNAKSTVIGNSRLTDSCRVTINRECLAPFSYKYKVKEHTDRLYEHLKLHGYELHCAHSQRNGMRFSNHNKNINHICDYPYKVKLEYKALLS